MAFFAGAVAAPGQPEQGAPRQGTGCHCGPRVHNIIVKSADASLASTAVEELLLTQEEADTRLLLHARHAAVSGYETVLITSDKNTRYRCCHHCLFC